MDECFPAWTNEWICQWNAEGINEWLKNEGMNGKMDEWATSLFSYSLAEPPFGWGAPSLSYFLVPAASYLGYFFDLLLLWDASPGLCTPKRAASAVRLAASSRNQKRRRVATWLMLPCTQPRQCILSPPDSVTHSRSIAPNQPTRAQHTRCELFRATPPRLLVFLNMFWPNRTRTSVAARIFPTPSSKSGLRPSFLHHWECTATPR